MGLFSLFKRKSEQVYCQSCGREITDEGGSVAKGRIYCPGYKELESFCLEKGSPGSSGNYFPPQEVQKLIRKGKLKEFGRLERETKQN